MPWPAKPDDAVHRLLLFQPRQNGHTTEHQTAMTAPVDNMSSPDFRGGRREGKSCAAQRHRLLFAGCDNSERGEVAAGAATDARVGWLARATSARLPDARIRRGQTV